MTKDKMDCRIYFILQRKLIWRLRQMDKKRKRWSVLTVAGPMIVTPFLSAVLISLRVRASGMPSAIMAMVRICIKIKRKPLVTLSVTTLTNCRTEKANSCSGGVISFCLIRPLGGHTVHSYTGRPSAWIHSLLWSSQQSLCSVQRIFFLPLAH